MVAGRAVRYVADVPVTGGRTVLLTGGLGGAHLAPALARALGPGNLTVVANVGDDLDWHGLRICPDVDTVLYALGGQLDRERGWGIAGDTFTVRAALAGLGGPSAFGVGDRDLATHLVRAELLRTGRTLTEATAEVARRLGVDGPAVLPASDEPCPTRLELADGRWVGFQEWYVGAGAEPPVRSLAPGSGPAAPAVLAALARADAVVLGPSNPVSSIGTVLALDGLAEAVARVPTVVAVSPVVLASPPPGPVAHHALARRRLLAVTGDEDTPAGVARHYARRHPGLVDAYLVDERDGGEVPGVVRAGLCPEPARLLDPGALAGALAGLLGARAAAAGARGRDRGAPAA